MNDHFEEIEGIHKPYTYNWGARPERIPEIESESELSAASEEKAPTRYDEPDNESYREYMRR